MKPGFIGLGIMGRFMAGYSIAGGGAIAGRWRARNCQPGMRFRAARNGRAT